MPGGNEPQMIPTREAMERARKAGIRSRASLFFNDRGLEWFSSLAMLSWGITLALPGDTLAGPQYASFDRFGMTEEAWAVVFCAAAFGRLVALYINGNWPRSPHIRMIGSAFGAVSWAQVAYLLTLSTYWRTGVAAPGTGLYTLLALVDLFGIARAAFDARYHNT